jgi:predicted ATPase
MFCARGEVWLSLGEHGAAEADFREALALARASGGKLYELRACIGMARVLQKRGHGEDARALLGAVYEWFPAGLEVLALREARGVLDGLGDGLPS